MATTSPTFSANVAPFSRSFVPFDEWSILTVNRLLANVANLTLAEHSALERFAEALAEESAAVRTYRNGISNNYGPQSPGAEAKLSLYAEWTPKDLRDSRSAVRNTDYPPHVRHYSADTICAVYDALRGEIRAAVKYPLSA